MVFAGPTFAPNAQGVVEGQDRAMRWLGMDDPVWLELVKAATSDGSAEVMRLLVRTPCSMSPLSLSPSAALVSRHHR